MNVRFAVSTSHEISQRTFTQILLEMEYHREHSHKLQVVIHPRRSVLKINLNYTTITRNFVVAFHLISSYRNAVDSKFAHSIVWQFLMKEVVSLALLSLVYLSTSTNFFSWIFILISSISSLVICSYLNFFFDAEHPSNKV